MEKSAFWEGRWSADNFSPKWANRGVSPEIIAAVKDGWFPPAGPVLDIGCGRGEIAAWFAKQGYETLGIDIAPSAVIRARETHAPLPANLEFMAVDACGGALPDRQYRVLIDRGCFHTIPPGSRASYTRTLASVAAPGARMLLFIRAFRHGQPFGDKGETEMHVDIVTNAYAGKFGVARCAPTYMDAHGGTRAGSALPGLVFWMVAPGVAPV